MEQPINQSVTKGRNIKNLVKSQPLLDVYRQYVWTFLIDLQVSLSNFSLFFVFSETLAQLPSFISYPLVIDLHLESFKNNHFELDFSISKIKRASTVKSSGRDEFFAR